MNQTGEDYLLYDADDEAINVWLEAYNKSKINSFFH
jgi:hypothetical protein